MNWLKDFFTHHVQKSMSAILILIDSANLAALELVHTDVVQMFGPTRGPTIFSSLRIGLGMVIFARASFRKTS